MQIKIDYNNFSLLDFINDAEFQDWIIQPTEEANLYWQQVEMQYPHKKEEIEGAGKFLKSIQFKESWPSEQKIASSLDDVLTKISNNEKIFPPKSIRSTTLKKDWWLAASAIIILGLISYFLQNQNHLPSTQQQAGSIIPSSHKATLTLDDGSTISLDSSENGTLTKQGNTTVVKLNNGQLAYNKTDAAGSKVLYNTISIPKGGLYQLTLADGTNVWLNAASSLRFPTSFEANERRVELFGEGYFEVAKDATKPFFVKVGDVTVEVLGTHFNINAYLDENNIATTLLEGEVKIKKGNQSSTLKPGQQVQLLKSNGSLKVNTNVNVNEILAWKEGKFLFRSRDIESILRQAARWYDVDIVYQSKLDETFSGGLARSENISELLKILAATDKIDFKINGRQIIVKQKKK